MYTIMNGNHLIFQINNYSNKYYAEVKDNLVYSGELKKSFNTIKSWVNYICKETESMSTNAIYEMVYLKESSVCDIWYNLSMITNDS